MNNSRKLRKMPLTSESNSNNNEKKQFAITIYFMDMFIGSL